MIVPLNDYIPDRLAIQGSSITRTYTYYNNNSYATAAAIATATATANVTDHCYACLTTSHDEMQKHVMSRRKQ